MEFSILGVFVVAIVGTVAGQEGCTHLSATDYPLTFTSHPDYPEDHYKPDTHRCWEIEAPSDMVVQLDSVSFQVEPENHCLYDSVKVRAYGMTERTFCGYEGIHSLRTTSGPVFVEFHTDESSEYSGFEIQYKAVDAETTTEDNFPDEYDYDFDPFVPYREALSFWTIFGIVVGCIIGVAVITTVIVLVVVCCVCNKRNQGTVVRTTAPGQANLAYTVNQVPYPQQQLAPPPYYPGGPLAMTNLAMTSQQQPMACQPGTNPPVACQPGTNPPAACHPGINPPAAGTQ